MRRTAGTAYVAMILGLLSFGPAEAQSADTFFASRQVRIIVGTGAGRGYDAYARLVARHLGRHLAGNPTFVVENMPGASGTRALNYLYANAPRDGSVIATFNGAVPYYQAVGQPGVRYKSEELSWIGSLAQPASVVAVWHTSGVRTIDDARRIEVILGATGATGTKASYPTLINNMLGTKFKIVTGYEGGNAVTLAIERGEVAGDGSSRWSSWKATRPEWVRDRKIVPVVQVGLKRDTDLPDVALRTDHAQNDEQRQMFSFVSAPDALGQPFAGPPQMPPERLNALRRAFDELVLDPAFRAEAEKAKLDVVSLDGLEAEKIVRQTVATPLRIIEKVQAATAVRDGVTGGRQN